MELHSKKKLKAAPQPRHQKAETRLPRPTGMTNLPPEVLREIFLWSKCKRTLPGYETKGEYETYTLGLGRRYEVSTKILKHRKGINWKIDLDKVNLTRKTRLTNLFAKSADYGTT